MYYGCQIESKLIYQMPQLKILLLVFTWEVVLKTYQ